MMIEQHYDEEVLIALLDEQATDPHLSSCATCRASLNSIRQVTSALHDDAVWDRRELDEEPRRETRDALRSFAVGVAAEDAKAEPWVKALLARPAAEWRAAVDAHPEWRTAGFVRKLIAAVDSINFTAPTDAVELTKIAVDVAEGLEGKSERLAKLRATAWREYGYALYYVGSHAEALRALDAAEATLQACRLAEYEIARTRLYRANIFGAIEKLEEATFYYRQVRNVFKVFGDAKRVLTAELGEGTILIRACRFEEALVIQSRIIDSAGADRMMRACAAQNAAVCCRELGRFEEARRLFALAIDDFESLQDISRRGTARWQLSRLLLSESQYEEALRLLADVREDFEALGMAQDVALTAVDAAEAFLRLGRPEEVAALCESAMRYFQKAQLTYTRGALTALAYLSEAAQSKSLTVTDIGDVRTFFALLPKQPELLFAKPA